MSMKNMARLRRFLMTSRMSLARMMAVGEPVELMTMSTSRSWSTMASKRMASPCMVLASSWAREKVRLVM